MSTPGIEELMFTLPAGKLHASLAWNRVCSTSRSANRPVAPTFPLRNIFPLRVLEMPIVTSTGGTVP